MEKERKQRSKFNRKYADYLPNIINTDLETESIDIIISDEQARMSNKFHLIDQIDIAQIQIKERFNAILREIFSVI